MSVFPVIIVVMTLPNSILLTTAALQKQTFSFMLLVLWVGWSSASFDWDQLGSAGLGWTPGFKSGSGLFHMSSFQDSGYRSRCPLGHILLLETVGTLGVGVVGLAETCLTSQHQTHSMQSLPLGSTGEQAGSQKGRDVTPPPPPPRLHGAGAGCPRGLPKVHEEFVL